MISCNKCQISRTGGNNNILSLILIKYSREQLKCIMTMIHRIIIKEKIYDFELNHNIEDFNITEDNQIYTFEQYLFLKINDREIDDNDYFFTLKSLFIISLIYDTRVKLYIFGDHTKSRFSTKINPKIDIKLFLTKCEQIVDDFKQKHLQLNEIAFYAITEWIEIGLYVL
jgi:hypothetical protein